MSGGKTEVGLVRALAIGAGYGLLAFASLSITRFGATVEAIWISNALLVWALAMSRPAQWPLAIGASAIGHVAAHLAAGDSLNLSLALLLADMAECLLAAALLQRRPGSLRFETRGATFYFLLVCGLVAPAVSTAIAWAASWLITGAPLQIRELIIWFSVDALALVLFLPIIYAVGEGRWQSLRGKFARVSFAAALVVAIAWFSVSSEMPLLRLLVLPLLVIVAFDLGVAAVQICLAVAFAAWTGLVYMGATPRLFGDVDMRDGLLLVQVLMAVFTATFLPLAVVLEEKQRLNDALAETIAETREAWGAIIGAEARYRLVVDNVSETVMRIKPGGLIVFASPACTALLHSDREFEGRNVFDLIHPDDREPIRERVRHTVDTGMFNLVQRWKVRFHGDDDRWHDIIARVTAVPLGKGEHEFIVVLRSEHDDMANS